MRAFLPLLIVFCFFGILSFGSDPGNLNLSFRRISPIGGFTYGSINTIAEDANGFIWFGTVHGLYCYNSVDVKKFVNIPTDSTTLPNNSIRTIFNDPSGKLWIGTSHGLCTYDISKDQFVTLNFQDDKGEMLGNNIREIFQGDDQNIYLLSTTMLGKLNIKSNHFEKVFSTRSSHENFASAASDLKGKLFIGCLLYTSPSPRD